eukprot:gene29928-16301_t
MERYIEHTSDKDWTIVPCFLCGLTHWKDGTLLRRLWSCYDTHNQPLPQPVMLQAPRLTRAVVDAEFSVAAFILHWRDPARPAPLQRTLLRADFDPLDGSLEVLCCPEAVEDVDGVEHGRLCIPCDNAIHSQASPGHIFPQLCLHNDNWILCAGGAFLALHLFRRAPP